MVCNLQSYSKVGSLSYAIQGVIKIQRIRNLRIIIVSFIQRGVDSFFFVKQMQILFPININHTRGSCKFKNMLSLGKYKTVPYELNWFFYRVVFEIDGRQLIQFQYLLFYISIRDTNTNNSWHQQILIEYRNDYYLWN